MMKRIILLFLMSLLFATVLQAQFYSTQYRLPNLEWQQLNTPHFKIIYPAENQAAAYRSALILESEYESIQELVGGNLKRFPFILNPGNDRSNGFVSPFNFRSEVELAPLLGKALNPRSGDWLETVLPHELVHAAHFSVNKPSLSRALGLFSPDLRRSVHAAAPFGVLEGIAVYHESHGTIPHSGRGNYPFFRNQFRANFHSDDPWSMGQLFHTSSNTLPFNRHYIGGYEFTHWLLHTYGEETMAGLINYHFRYPFFGFGMALKRATGDFPGKLYGRFSKEKNRSEQLRLNLMEESTDGKSVEIPFQAKCVQINRPLWLSEDEVLFHARSCTKASGFYRYRQSDDHLERIQEVSASSDYIYSLNSDRSQLYFSRFHPNLRYDNVFKGDLHRINLVTGQSERLTKNQRVFSPEKNGNELLSLKTDGIWQRLVSVDEKSGDVLTYEGQPEESSVVQVAAHPRESGRIALVGKINSVQALWIQSDSNSVLSGLPDVAFENGSLFDISWHPSENKLLFTSDHSGVMNIYEYSSDHQTVTQLTNSIYNAYEASWSPNGESLAFIRQVENEQKLFVLNRDDLLNREVSPELWKPGAAVRSQLNRPVMNRESLADTTGWTSETYRTGLSWLKPRLWIPEFESETFFNKLGIRAESGDLMSRHAYTAELFNYADRFWYDVTYRYTGFFPGFEVSYFNEPFVTGINIDDSLFLFIQEQRGGSLKIPFRYQLEQNARFTSFIVQPEYSFSQIRFLDIRNSSSALSKFSSRSTFGLQTIFNYRLRQFSKDVQPNSGWVFFSEFREGLNGGDIRIRIPGSNNIIEGELQSRRGARAGLITYLSPLKRWHQSLRLQAQVISQTRNRVFNTVSIYSDNFTNLPFFASSNLGFFDTRYTIPVVHPDNGGLLLPGYLSSIYLVLFSQTVLNLDQKPGIQQSRSLFGVGIRSRVRLSNLAVDIGISIGWEPTRNEIRAHAGGF